MSIVLDLFCFMVSLTIPAAVVLSVLMGVGGCLWPSAFNVGLVIAPIWAFSKSALYSDSLTDERSFFRIWHKTCIGALRGASFASSVA